jgi:hypothetical protein
MMALLDRNDPRWITRSGSRASNALACACADRIN